jgi:hypothetical protein
MQDKHQHCTDKLHYLAVKELFRFFGINPYEFYEINKEHLCGYFPNIKDRTPRISMDRLSHVFWED